MARFLTEWDVAPGLNPVILGQYPPAYNYITADAPDPPMIRVRPCTYCGVRPRDYPTDGKCKQCGAALE